MRPQNAALAGAVIAGLLSGSTALALEPTIEGLKPIPSPTASKATRKPHKDILNKMKCCKNGCDCMKNKKEPTPKE